MSLSAEERVPWYFVSPSQEGQLDIEESNGCSNVQSVSQLLLCLPIVTICAKREEESTAGQEEGKDKFQKAGMFPESMYFMKYLKLLAFVNSAAHSL